MDHLARNDNVGDPGVPLIVAFSFSGSSGNLQQSYQDVMAVACQYSKPDLFLTYTCNPKCSEITDSLGPSEIVPCFHQGQINELMLDIKDRHIQDMSVSLIHVIEF